MNEIVSHLNNHFHLTANAAEKMGALMSKHIFEKGQEFVIEGNKDDKEYLLFKGICRSYVKDADGNDITLSFFTDNTCISPNLTRTKSNLSISSIQAIVESTMVSFPSQGLMELMSTHREIELWANAILKNELMHKVEKEISQISNNAKERLLNFRSQYPSLENQIPHSYISSFLGITNVSLSRLRKELASS